MTLEGGKVVVTDNGLEMSSENSPHSRTNFAQILEHKLADDGIYTLSVLYNGNQLATRSGQKALNETAPINGFGYARFYDTNRGSIVEFVCNTENFEAVINAVKLEPGPVQTLAHQDTAGNWVLNDPPPDPTLELLKCQRYFKSIGGVDTHMMGQVNSSKANEVIVNVPGVPMRATPTLSYKPIYNSSAVVFDGQPHAVTGAKAFSDKLFMILIDSDLPAKGPAAVYLNEDIWLSAEL